MDNWSIVYRTVYPQDIYLAKSFLESEGIATLLRDELTTQVDNFYSNAIGGVKLLVNNADLERSRELLVQGGYIIPEESDVERVEVIHTPDRRHCPYCGSEQISRKREPDISVVVMYFILQAFVPVFKRTYRCWDCGRSWKFGRKRQPVAK